MKYVNIAYTFLCKVKTKIKAAQYYKLDLIDLKEGKGI